MTAKFQGVQVPAGATVDIHIHVTAPVNITPFVARQKVNAFVKMEMSTQLRGEQPDLIVGERLCWSVPIVLGFPDRGIVGKVGEIQVDATTGELLIDEQSIRRMTEDARRLADSTSV
ncbi:MAG: hypothetical protein HYS12_12110 [Planctomycetes bacterium]|nr:hypothetical protein [Planctomycetota bacterium]